MKKEKLLDYFLQLTMVILGVFLGMMASDWSSNKQHEEDKQNLILGIKTEINNNLDYLKARRESDIIPFFNSLDSVSSELKSNPDLGLQPFKQRPMLERIPNFPGLGRPQLDDAMFEATKFSNMLPYFDVEMLKQLTTTYNLQYNIQATRRTIDLQFIGIDGETTYAEAMELMWEVMQSYFGAQYRLIEEYEKTVGMIES